MKLISQCKSLVRWKLLGDLKDVHRQAVCELIDLQPSKPRLHCSSLLLLPASCLLAPRGCRFFDLLDEVVADGSFGDFDRVYDCVGVRSAVADNADAVHT